MQMIKKGISSFGKLFSQAMTNIKTVRIKYWWLILFSVLIHRLPFALIARDSFVDVKRICMIVSYVLLLWALSRNLNFRSIRIMSVGTLLNFIAIIVNGGLMPLSPEARQLAQMTPLDQSQLGMVLSEGSGILLPLGQTNLWFITDIIPAHHLGGVYSPGDILIALGFLFFLIEIAFSKNTTAQPTLSNRSASTEGDSRKLIEKRLSY